MALSPHSLRHDIISYCPSLTPHCTHQYVFSNPEINNIVDFRCILCAANIKVVNRINVKQPCTLSRRHLYQGRFPSFSCTQCGQFIKVEYRNSSMGSSIKKLFDDVGETKTKSVLDALAKLLEKPSSTFLMAAPPISDRIIDAVGQEKFALVNDLLVQLGYRDVPNVAGTILRDPSLPSEELINTANDTMFIRRFLNMPHAPKQDLCLEANQFLLNAVTGATDTMDTDQNNDLNVTPDNPDVTDCSPNCNVIDNVDDDLQRAIQLSLAEEEKRKKLIESQEHPDDEEALRKAIQASLREGGVLVDISEENAAINKVIHRPQSMADMDDDLLLVEAMETIERRFPKPAIQDQDAFVGINNAGNTCYFNSLLQTYFGLPVFKICILSLPLVVNPETGNLLQENERNRYLKCKCPSAPQCQSECHVRCRYLLLLLYELQKLFCFLAFGVRPSIDAIDLLKAILTVKYLDSDLASTHLLVGMQEDVTEFNGLFLSYIQEALDLLEYEVPIDLGSVAGSGDVLGTHGRRGLMEALFYGKLVETFEAREEDNSNVKQTTDAVYSHIIVQSECGDLSAAMRRLTGYERLDSFETPKGYRTDLAKKKTLLRSLPPVILFQIQRTRYDPLKKSVIKVHDPFLFDHKVYLDIYLEKNDKDLIKYVDICDAYDSKLGKLKDDNNTEIIHLKKQKSKIESRHRRCPYSLHSLLMHKGQADSGHYWVYVRESANRGDNTSHTYINCDRWIMFNDSSVNDVQFDEMLKVARGQPDTRTSAYCLVYVNDVKGTEALQLLNLPPSKLRTDIVPPELIKLVDEDNKKCVDAVEQWNSLASRAERKRLALEELDRLKKKK